MKTSSSLFILIAVIFAGCSEHGVNPNQTSNPKQIYPLATGDVRIYVDSLFFSDGSVAEVAFDTEWVGMTVSVQNEIWYVISNNDYPRGDLYANRNDGYWNNFSNQSYLVYKYPATMGEIYHNRIDTFDIQNGHIQADRQYTKVASINTKISVGDSAYFCYYYQTFLYNFKDIDTGSHKPWWETYVCPGVGRIRTQDTFDETWTRNGTPVKNGTESETLIKYLLK